MKKQLVFLLLIFIVKNEINAQCPLGVGINSVPAGYVCKGNPVNYTATPSVGATNPQYVWLVNGDTVGTGVSITNSISGDVTVYMTSSTCFPDTVAFNQVTHQSVIFIPDYEVLLEEGCGQTQADLQVNEILSVGGLSPYTYNLSTFGEQVLYTDLAIGTYPLYVADANNCMDTLFINVSNTSCEKLVPIEAITPNDDGENDMFTISNIQQYPNNEVFIYDRWGQRVYYKKNYDNVDGWKAKYLGLDMPVSTYYYVIKITREQGEDINLIGPVSVFR